MTDLATIQELSAAGRHQDCLLACQNALQINPDETFTYKYAGKSLLALGQFEKAQQCLVKAHQLDGSDPEIAKDIGNIFHSIHNYQEAKKYYNISLEINPNYAPSINNLGLLAKREGDLTTAEQLVKKARDLDQSFAPYHMNLGGIYRDLGQLDQALAATLTSLELKPDNPTAHMNLGGIYKELGQLDQSLASTLKSLELKPDNTNALDNLRGLIDKLTPCSANAQNITKAYELLINLDSFSHRRLSKIFIQAFLTKIKEASKFDPIISIKNYALANLAADWRLRKSLTLLIPPHQAIEHFFTRLRQELLTLAATQKPIQGNLKVLTEALATQCFLNEYVYAQTPEEEAPINQLISRVSESQEAFNQYLAIIACYTPIHKLDLNQEWLDSYPTSTYESRMLIKSQLQDPLEEIKIKATIQSEMQVTDAVSAKVQDMYEKNPYPRYCYADYTEKSLAKNISEAIGVESTKHNLQFKRELISNNLRPKVLIAGCGTGNQVINASRYRNSQITAIDLSDSSLAYAIRKANEYGMDNIDFRKMDLLDVAALDEIFDTIECGGVLHHMEDPSKGLSALNQQLTPGGYIKLGLYSETARQYIVRARNRIKQLGSKSTEAGIKKFRQQVLRGEFSDLINLPNLSGDFYSLSTCRDLCFHVQEHRFTAKLLKEFLENEGLIFCGFILPEVVKNNYKQQFPSDTDMTSLENWGDFEEQHPSTFRAMYQFWAYKSS